MKEVQKKERKPGSGGARPGAGVKPVGKIKMVQMTLTISQEAKSFFKIKKGLARDVLEKYWREADP